MLPLGHMHQVTEIVQIGIEGMEEDGYKSYFLQFVCWSNKEKKWIVGFHSPESSLTVGVVVHCDYTRGYTAVGRTYE